MSTELIGVEAELTKLRNDIQHLYEEEENCLVSVILQCVVTENLSSMKRKLVIIASLSRFQFVFF